MALRPSFRLRAGAFDLAIALFAAGSIGFAAFAMPEWRLNSLLEASGLPQILPAARPPLGSTARLGSAALFAIAAFGGVLMLMRLLDRLPSRKAKDAVEDEVPFEPMIRLRRSDAHPDNPARRPLVAGRELGEPFDELVLRKPDRAERSEEPTAGFGKARSLPAFLTPEDAQDNDDWSIDEEIVDYVELPAEDSEPPSMLDSAGPIEEFAEPVASDPLSPAFRPVVPDAVVPDLIVPDPVLADPAPEFVPEPAPVAFEEPAPFEEHAEPMTAEAPIVPMTAETVPIAAEAPVAPLAAPAPVETGEESITALMARLDAGLRRREHSPSVGGAASPPPASGGDEIADRLRNAMTDLQKLTARG